MDSYPSLLRARLEAQGIGILPGVEDTRVIAIALPIGENELRLWHTWSTEAKEVAYDTHVAAHRAAEELGIPGLYYRGVDVGRLNTVLATGIDVQPTTASLFATPFIDKALEYSGVPKMVLLLRSDAMDQTHRELPASTDAVQIERLQLTFPTRVDSEDGTRVWLSRLRHDDPRVTTDYETEYARWIPGNAQNALLAVVLLHAGLEAG